MPFNKHTPLSCPRKPCRSAHHGPFPGRRSNEDSNGLQLTPWTSRKPDASGTPGEPTCIPESPSSATFRLGMLVDTPDVMDIIIDKPLENASILRVGRLKLQVIKSTVSWEERLLTANEDALFIRHSDGDLRYRLKLLEMSECSVHRQDTSQVLLNLHTLCTLLPCALTSPCHDVRVASN